MGRINIRETRPSAGQNKRTSIWKLLTKLGIPIQKLFTNGTQHTAIADDRTIEELAKKTTKTEFAKEGLDIVDPPELDAKRTLIIKQVDGHIHEENTDTIKNELERLNTYMKITSVIKLPNTNTILKIKMETTTMTPPQLSLGTHSLQVVQSAKLLGITIDDHLNWNQHINNIIRTASYKLFMLRRLKSLGTPLPDLKGVYTTFVLPTLMYASPAWSSSLNITQRSKLEKVQRRACRIILGSQYEGYENALTTLSLPRLSDKHSEALNKFGQDLILHPRHCHFLPPNTTTPRHATRHSNKIKPIRAPRTDRYKNSAIPSIVRTINSL
ncbi:uncharacterized protein LOC143023141 [Oratosquilla oratoria]|uniref:uncharacterized protein LOC143023141 n=1 Tax=Oratosquilla oratoria TaxID=337810 RepID=UPI003F75A99B